MQADPLDIFYNVEYMIYTSQTADLLSCADVQFDRKETLLQKWEKNLHADNK